METKPRSGTLLARLQMRKGLLAMLIIGMAWYALFQFYPMVKVHWAFTNIGQVAPSKVTFTGLKNFTKLFSLARFRRSLSNTFYISFLKILFGFPIPIFFALMLNEMRINRPNAQFFALIGTKPIY